MTTYYLLHTCLEECRCGCSPCLVETVIEELRRKYPTRIWRTGRDAEPGRSLLEFVDQELECAERVFVLWTRKTKQAISTKDEGTSKFLYFVEMADLRAPEKFQGNFVVHVELEEDSVPKRFSEWATPVKLSNIDRAIAGRSIDYIDLSPCGHVAIGLAWTFTTYFMAVLPSSGEPRQTFSERLIARLSTKGLDATRVFSKLITIIPFSGIVPSEIPGCNKTEYFTEVRKTVAGVKDRSFKSTVYEVKDGEQSYYAAIEYATPVRAMHLMTLTETAGMSRDWLQHEVDVFNVNLQNICQLYLSAEEMDQMVIIPVDDMQYSSEDLSEYASNDAVAEKVRGKILDTIKKAMLPERSTVSDIS